MLGKSVELAPGEEIYYGEDVSEEEATKLGRGLKKHGFELKDVTMRLSKEEGRLRISVVVVDGAWEDPEVLSLVSNIAVFASTEIYEKKPVDAAIWDEEFTVRRLVRYEEALAKVLKEQVKEDGAKKESVPKG